MTESHVSDHARVFSLDCPVLPAPLTAMVTQGAPVGCAVSSFLISGCYSHAWSAMLPGSALLPALTFLSPEKHAARVGVGPQVLGGSPSRGRPVAGRRRCIPISPPKNPVTPTDMHPIYRQHLWLGTDFGPWRGDDGPGCVTRTSATPWRLTFCRGYRGEP